MKPAQRPATRKTATTPKTRRDRNPKVDIPSSDDTTTSTQSQPPDAASGPIDEPPPCLLPTTDEVVVLTRRQQDEYLTLLTKGASPAAACQKLEVSITAVLVTMEQSPKFHQRATAVSDVLSQNVAAQLYQTAMKGSVTAQTFYLRNQPPPEWPDEDSGEKTEKSQPPLEISDERLVTFVEKARNRKSE